ncbi:MAG: branched-chain amino acid ABC transporter permease [Thermomicrobiaceae bacterium]|nr:branched-chain amino acid ABC transporter permease [Thermomicrobiaceae bacterium]
MVKLIQALLFGISNGFVIALIALGYTLVYGIIELINFAHGEVYMMGSFMALTIVAALGVTYTDPWGTRILAIALALIGAMLFSGIINFSIDRFAYRRLRRAPRLAPLITAIGVSFILQNLAIWWKGPRPLNFPGLLPQTDVLNDWLHLHTSIFFSLPMLFVIVVTGPLLFGLTWFINHTRLGKAMRATAQDREAAALMGIDVNRTIGLTFLLGGLMAGAAGLINGLYNNQVAFNMGFIAGLLAFTAAVLGGIGNLTGAVAGGLILGIVASLSDTYWDAQWTPAIVFAVLVLIIVFKPTGLFGEIVERA